LILKKRYLNIFQSNMARWLEATGTWAPFWLGLIIVVTYLLIRCGFDGFFMAIWGFPQGVNPLWLSETWWTQFVNALLLGYIAAVLMIARRGVEGDLGALRPQFPRSVNDFDKIGFAATVSPGLAVRLFELSGLAIGFMVAYLDPQLSSGTEVSVTNPIFMWALFHTSLFVWAVFVLLGADLRVTRSYYYAGKNLLEIDLLNVQSMSAFARRGLRSALTWVVFSVIFSLFWLGEGTAARQNIFLLVATLAMATGAFIFPLIGVRSNILAVKNSELDRLRAEIRVERKSIMKPISADRTTSPRLANLIAYYQLVERAREWPIDAVNILKFCLYMLIGLGSWLGAAIVERLLDSSLAS